MQSFLDCFASAPYLVGDGSIYERITRGGLVRHDPHIASASAIYDPAGRKAMAEFYTQYWDLAAMEAAMGTGEGPRLYAARMEVRP